MSGRGRTGMLLPVLMVLWTGTVVSAQPAEQKDLDEVVVRGRTVQLKQLHDQIRDTENLFYDRFNELNTVREFDVHCGMETPTGTQLKHRRCRVVFEEDALEQEGQEAIRIRQFYQSPGGSRLSAGPILTGAPTNPSIKMNALRPVFQKHMKEVVSRDPELIQMLQKRKELAERYEALRREIFGLAPVPAEAEESLAP